MILYLNLLTSLIMATTDTAASPRFTPQDLPYAYDALAPAISEETMHYHHDKHYAGYVDKLNELIVDTPFAGQPLEDIILSADGPVYNNAAQAWNHAFFFGQLSPKPQKEPSGELLEAINRNFGSLDELKVQIGRAAAGLFGSGWVWLAEDPSGRLAVVSEQNAGNPMRHGMKPLLAIDVWSMRITSTTGTAAPMLSRPSGASSTGRSWATDTLKNRRFPPVFECRFLYRKRHFLRAADSWICNQNSSFCDHFGLPMCFSA